MIPALVFKLFFILIILKWSSKLFHDFRDSHMDFYDFHDIRNSPMGFNYFHDFRNSHMDF